MPYQSVRNRRSGVSWSIGRPVWLRPQPAIVPERILDMIPGGLAWFGLAMVVAGAYYAPLALVLGASLLGFYSAIRFSFAGIATLWGLRRIRRWETLDWQRIYTHRATPGSLPLDHIHHVVLIPNYQENIHTLRRSLNHLARQSGAKTSISVVLAMEGRESGALDKATRLQREFGAQFAYFFIAAHPRSISGEIQCKSANQAWAARWTRHMMVDELGYDIDHLLVTTMDSDTLWHPAYFEALRVLFATNPNRYATFWQAPIRYHGNVWSTNPLMRILHAYSSAWELAYLTAPWWQALPMSSYSLSMRLLDSVDYWDPDVIADEWHMYIKSFFQRKGDVHLEPVFLPFWASATTGDTLAAAVKARYLQTLRHAWGAKEIGYTLAQMVENPHGPRPHALALLLRVAHDNILAGFGWVVITLGAQLPMLFHPGIVRQNLDTLPFILLQISLTTVSLLTIMFWAVDLHNRPPRGKPWTWGERMYELVSLPLVAVMTTLCVAMPVLHAQTRLMLGQSIEFRVTPK